MWHEVLSKRILAQSHLRIYYNKKFFHYPLRAANALFGLGLWNSALSLLSWAKAKTFPERPEETFEQWVSNRFGKRLYRIFFKTYTEKVWGIPCNEITADRAAQRIKGLSLLSAVKNALLNEVNTNGDVIKNSSFDSFDYPELGPGMMWEAVSEITLKDRPVKSCLKQRCPKSFGPGKRERARGQHSGKENLIEGTHFISSMPMRELIQKFDTGSARGPAGS